MPNILEYYRNRYSIWHLSFPEDLIWDGNDHKLASISHCQSQRVTSGAEARRSEERCYVGSRFVNGCA